MDKNASHLEGLANPDQYNQPIDFQLIDSSQESLLAMLKTMLMIRRSEELIADMIEAGEVKCPCHLGIGQEAIAVGVAQSLRKSDRVFGTHRAHAHYLSMGGGVYELFAESLGKATGCAGGLGGSQHLYAADKGFYGSLPIVAGTVPIAVGAGLAAKLDGAGDIGVCFFGDGAAEEGVVHESLNLASAQEIPVLFVCENNLFSSHLDILLRQPSDKVSRFAEASMMKTLVVDGNDIVAMQEAGKELIDYIRETGSPAFLEAVTYRWRGHVGPKEDIDVGVRRKKEDLLAWKKRDPIKRMVDGLIAEDYLNETAYQEIINEVELNLQNCLVRAKAAPYPDPSTLLDGVYATTG